MSLAHKTAIITGATRGIGLAIANAFAQQCVHTVLIGRNADRVKSVQEKFQHEFGSSNHKGIVLDVSNKLDIDRVMKVRILCIGGGKKTIE